MCGIALNFPDASNRGSTGIADFRARLQAAGILEIGVETGVAAGKSTGEEDEGGKKQTTCHQNKKSDESLFALCFHLSVSSIDLRPATLGSFKRGSISRQAIQTLFIAEWVECLPSTFASNQTLPSIPAPERDPGTAEREAGSWPAILSRYHWRR